MSRSVLIMTYEFPPSGGGGVQRVTKMSRYLPEFGWQPVVLAAEIVPGRPLDPSLATEVAHVEVVRTPARHVATAISNLLAPAKSLARSRNTTPPAEKPASVASASPAVRGASVSRRISRWFAFDDAVLWQDAAVAAAVRLGRERGVEAVIATGPPYSVVVAGARVASELGVPLVADMRDGWDRNPVNVRASALHRRFDQARELRVMEQAAVVTATSSAIVDEASDFGATRIELVPNGYDPADLVEHAPDATGPLRIAYMGRIYYGQSDPTPIFEAMARLASAGGDAARIEFDIVGSYPEGVPEAAQRLDIGERVHFHGYLPHREALEIVARADVGLVIVEDRPGADATAPAKLYEYLGMGMTVLLLAPETGFPAAVLTRTGGGVRLDAADTAALDATLKRWVAEKTAGSLDSPDPEAVALYDRRRQAGRMAEVLASVAAPTE